MKKLTILLSAVCFSLLLAGCCKCQNTQIDTAFDLHIVGFKAAIGSIRMSKM